MALLDDILKWTETDLTLWQRDAARRLFQQEEGLSDDDYTQLYSLLKAAHGLPNPLELAPAPLSAAHLPAAQKAGEAVILKTMRDLKHVNRIAPEQKLNFSPTGMTVIYGGNGSGKSGYGRVLKRACRARDQAEIIHPDATNPEAKKQVPRAIFDVEVNGEMRSLDWEYGNQSPDELSTIAVFDSHCARAYLTSEQDIAYLPYGLDVVENLANKVIPELARRLESEIAGVSVDQRPFSHLIGETEVGRLISGLSEKADPVKIKTLATLTEQETNRAAELDQALSEADPIAKAKELRLSAGRLKELANRIAIALAWVSSEAVAKFKDLDDACQTAVHAENLAAAAFRSNENLLPGTGETVWKALFEAARRFSTEVAYPGNGFPHTDLAAVCPLCQQPLGDGAERLIRFEKYIREDAAKVAAEKRQQVESAETKIERANVTVELGASLAEELTLLDDTVVPNIRDFVASLEARRSAILDAIATHSWVGVPALSVDPYRRLRDLAAQQLKSARMFETASDHGNKKELIAKRDELRARQSLGKCLDAVLGLVERMKLKSALESCKKDLKTRRISSRSKEFASNAVTAALKAALDGEFEALGIDHIETKLKERNHKGKMMYQLLLDVPSAFKLEEILSEGEQRAIAIGSFLAELQLANHSGGIVFDDPVTSLDHDRREAVAKRIVEESASGRQVIVFTHDVLFLESLSRISKLKDVPSKYWTVSKIPDSSQCGSLDNGIPATVAPAQDMAEGIRRQVRQFAGLFTSGRMVQWNVQTNSFSIQLRKCWERAVADALSPVVKRFDASIDTKNVWQIAALDDSDFITMRKAYKRCSELNHEKCAELSRTDPTPSDYYNEVDEVMQWLQIVHQKQETAQQNRPSL